MEIDGILSKADLHNTTFSHATNLRHAHARVLTHPLLVCLIFPKYSPVRNKNVITENLPTGFDLTRVLFRDSEQTNPYGWTTKASLS